MTPANESLLELAARIVSAHVGHNEVGHQDVPKLIRDVYATLVEVGQGAPAAAPVERRGRTTTKPTPDILTCLECGMRMKMLKRHLITVHGLTPEDYRAKHNLPADEPMVTSNYAKLRSELAKASGLGKRPTGRRGR